MKCSKKTMKQGAASFYVVAFSTLILLIVVASFTALVIAQITRSSNDDLSQSAYDSALAGVEDAKLAYYSYQNCLAQGAEAKAYVSDYGSALSCGEIINLVENSYDDCDIVARILGRTVAMDSDGNRIGVMIDETTTSGASGTSGANNMQQAYTCAKLKTSLSDYRATLSESSPFKAFNVRIDNMGNDGISLNSIKKMKVSWGSELTYNEVKMTNSPSGVRFKKVENNKPDNPPTIAIGIVQAESQYKAKDLHTPIDGRTDKGIVYLTPVDQNGTPHTIADRNYSHYGTTFEWDAAAQMNVSKINASALVNSNDAVAYHRTYGVSCPYVGEGEFACATMIELPEPVDSNGDGTGVRSDQNFIVAMFLPYGGPTDIMIEFFCADGAVCGVQKAIAESGEAETQTARVNLKGVQVEVDSTGKANDLFRRVDTRLENSGSSAMSIMGPLELFGLNDDGGQSVSMDKDYPVTCEWNFDPITGPGCLETE